MCLSRLVFEYPATGGCIPSFTFRTVKLIRYVTAFDHFVMACEGIFILFIIYYTIEEILEIKKHKLKYFKSFWNVLDVIVIFLGYVAIAFNLYRTFAVDHLLKGLLADNEQYANFDSLGFWQTQFNNMVAVAVFFAWIKVKQQLLRSCRSRVGAVVRALTFHQCVPGSIPGPGVICGLSLLVLYSAPRGFSPGTPVFPSPQKPTFDLIY